MVETTAKLARRWTDGHGMPDINNPCCPAIIEVGATLYGHDGKSGLVAAIDEIRADLQDIKDLINIMKGEMQGLARLGKVFWALLSFIGIGGLIAVLHALHVIV